MSKVLGTQNPADVNTKRMSGDEIAKYTKMLSVGYKEGRSELAPEANHMLITQTCVRYNSTSFKITHRVKTQSAQSWICKSLDRI